MADGEPKPGLSWPNHDTGPIPPPEYRDTRDSATRRPVQFWDRIKLLVLLVGTWFVLLWSTMASNPELPRDSVVSYSLRAHAWLLILAGIEVVRQLHYYISEQYAGYHRFWTERFFGAFSKRSSRMNDWTRFRMARAGKWLLFLFLVSLVLSRMLKRCSLQTQDGGFVKRMFFMNTPETAVDCANLHPVEALFQVPLLVWTALPVILQILLLMFMMIMQFVAIFWFLSKGGVDTYMPEDIKTRFSDVWGQDHVLNKVQENMIFLEDPESIEDKGGYVPSGILLWGPPGTGKTLMAEAIAGETNRPFVFVEPSAFINMFIGVGILKVKSLFRKLRKLALRYGGVIVFFDEADSLGSRGAGVAGTGGWQPSGFSLGETAWSNAPGCHGLSYLSPRSAALVLQSALDPSAAAEPRRGIVNRIIMGAGMGGGGGMGTLQALLSEMSGLKKPRGFINRVVRRVLGMKPKPPPKYRILVIMATNMPSALDPAMLRPGRLDRIYKVGYPSKDGRIRTYEGYFAKVRHNLTQEEVEKLAVMTPYATGASIKDLVNEALINSIRQGRQWITWNDVIKARLLKALGPPEDVEYIERERHAVAIHEACHAVVAYRVRKHLMIDIATIEKGQDYLGMVASIPLEEQFTQWRTEYDADLMVALAAMVGEKLFFELDSSSGVTSDLVSATTVAMFMEGFWGMGATVGSHGAAGRFGHLTADTAKFLQTKLGERVERKLQEIVQKTHRLLEENRREVLAVAHALETHKTLTGDDVEAIIEGRVGPLVDGRPYHTPGFAQIAEAYHSRALDAHKGHGKVEASLPVLDGQQVASTPAGVASQHPLPGSE